MNDKDYYMDVDLAIDRINDQLEEGEEPMTRRRFSEVTGIGYQNLINYKGGKLPVVIPQVMQIMNLCSLKIDELIKPREL